MDQTLAFMSNYHRGANERFFAALEALSPEAREADRGSYYKSLKGLASHVVGGELFILKFLLQALPGRPELQAPAIAREFKPGSPAFAAFEDEREAIKVFDEAFTSLSSSLDEATLSKPVDVMGKPRTVRSLLISAFMHAAHHRSQASQILDEDKIENDFYAAIREVQG